MSDKNPQIDKQLDKLADICCQSLSGEQTVPSDVLDALLKSLLMSGFSRDRGKPLQVELENRVKLQCREKSMHRGGALTSLCGNIQKQFDQLARWESEQPEDPAKSNASNGYRP